LLASRRSGERGLAFRNQHVLGSPVYRQRVVLFLEPNELGLQVTYALLKTTHLRYHAGIGTADVTE
jgi:hypothetical protein